MELRDCTWCGSAASIEYGVCQVCLMRFPDEDAPSIVIRLPDQLEEPQERKAASSE